MCSCECFLAALNQPALLHLEVTTEQLLGASWYIPAAVTPPGMAAEPVICQAFAQAAPVCHPLNEAPCEQQQHCPELSLLSLFNLKILPCLRVSSQRASSVRKNLPGSCGRSGQKQRPAIHDIVAGVLAPVQQPDCASLRTCGERRRASIPR